MDVFLDHVRLKPKKPKVLLSLKLKILINFCFVVILSCPLFSAANQGKLYSREVQFPIYSIVLSTDMTAGGQPAGDTLAIYECPGDNCMVIFSNSDLLSYNLFRKEIKAGSYRYVTVSSCALSSDTSFTAKLKGTALINGVNYYTHTQEAFKLKAADEPAEFVSVTFDQCRFYYELQQDLVITDSDVTPLTMFYDLHQLGWGTQSVQNTDSGCYQGVAGSGGLVFSACMGVPHLIPIPSKVTPTIDRYHIYKSGSDDTTAGGMMVFFLTHRIKLLVGLRAAYTLKLQKRQILMRLIWR